MLPRFMVLQHLRRRPPGRRCFFSSSRFKNILAHEAAVQFRRNKSGRRIQKLFSSLFLVAGSALAGLAFVSSASARYGFDPSHADEKSGGIKYFGSAKDDRGTPLPGVAIWPHHQDRRDAKSPETGFQMDSFSITDVCGSPEIGQAASASAATSCSSFVDAPEAACMQMPLAIADR